jgi:hypothetical protein
MKYFTIPELERTSEPEYKNSNINVALGDERKNLVTLVEHVLDPLRERWGAPIRVNSGYRCPALNRKVGGVPNSYHLRGMAADINARCPFHNTALYTEIRIMHREGLLPLTECYMSPQGTYIHVAYDPANVKPNPFLDR